MPIDARIPLMVQPAQIDSPMEMAGNFLKLREARERSQELQRQRMEDEQIKSIFQQTGGDIGKALPMIYQVSPAAGMEIEKRYGAAQKATQELETAKLQHDLALTNYVAQEVADVKDQRSWDFTRAGLEAVTKQKMRPDYDPIYIEGLQKKSMTYQQTLAQQHQDMVDKANAAREERMAADQRADNERQAAAAEQSKRQFETTEARQNREFAITSGRQAQAEARLAKAAKEGKGPEGIKLSAEAQKDLTTMLTVKDINNEILTLGDKVKWKGVGAFGAGSASQLGAKMGYGTEDEIGLRTKIGNVRGTIAVLRGGTSFTEGEKALLDTYTPDINDSAREIRVKIRGLNDLVETKRRNLLRVASGEWTGTGTSAAPPGDVEVWERGPDGKPRKVKR